ncbi:MAG: ATP-binding cassette domain-containing protein [Nitrospirota bacterium]
MADLLPQPVSKKVSSESIITLQDISKSFVAGKRMVQALDKMSARVRGCMITGLVGPDGSGKTTLMRLIAGLLEPDTGTVTVLGKDAAAESLLVQASIGYMPQRFGLYEDLTVSENLILYADLQGVPHDARHERFQELMQMTGLGPFASRLAGRLSGGMKQKLGLACTLVQSPELLLLDEPTVGVDPVSRRELWSIVSRLVREEGMSVLLSTSYLDEAEQCSEIIMMFEGKVLGQDSPEKFSNTMKGRTYIISAPGMKGRILQKKMLVRQEVADAIIQGDRVRLVLNTQGGFDAASLASVAADSTLRPAEPRFEDAFVSILRQQRSPGIPEHKENMKPGHAPGANGRNAIEVMNLKRRFGNFYAVKGVTFSVARGEVFGLLGPNGAGKSTTFRMLCGLLPPSEGMLSVAGHDLRRAPAAARAHIGYMSQKFSLYGNLSVTENLRFFSRVYGLTGEEGRKKIRWALDQFELSDHAESTSSDLSLGHKQRLAMACSLMHEPDILFLDEPTSGVDPLARREFWHRINALAEQGVTVLVTTHFMEEADYCDRLAIMTAGEILALGTPSEIKSEFRSAEIPDPTMEDAFISLIGQNTRGNLAP